MPAIYALMQPGTHQTSYIRSVKERGRDTGVGGGEEWETDNVRHKQSQTEKEMMDGWIDGRQEVGEKGEN